jgi:putative SOS response-associated peptidase YedK
MRWGLIPYWWKKPLKQLPASFNARAETVADKPMFRGAFARRRCIIPASGSAADGGVLSLAGLWDKWRDPATGEPTTSCTIIVTAANALTRPIHDRMPIILDKADFAAWLGGTGGAELLRSAADEKLRLWPVSRRVNKTGNGDDDPKLIDEIHA